MYSMRAKGGSGVEADRIISYLVRRTLSLSQCELMHQNGAMDAVEKKYLSKLTFFIYLDEEDPDK